MKLLTKSIAEKLLRNGRISSEYAEEGKDEPNFNPVTKLFTPDAQCTWLLSELEAIRGRLGHPVERDQYFTAYKTISAYAEEARISGASKA